MERAQAAQESRRRGSMGPTADATFPFESGPFVIVKSGVTLPECIGDAGKPTWGTATTAPSAGGSMLRGIGAFLSRER